MVVGRREGGKGGGEDESLVVMSQHECVSQLLSGN